MHTTILNLHLLRESRQLSQLLDFIDECFTAADGCDSLDLCDLLCDFVFTNVEIDGCVLEVAHLRDLVVDVGADKLDIIAKTMLFQLARECFKDWCIKTTGATMLFVYFKNHVFTVISLECYVLESICSHNLHMRKCFAGFSCVHHLCLVIQKLLNEFIQVDLD